MKPYIWALLTAIVWGIAPICEKAGLARMTPLTGLFYRCIGVLIAAGVLLGIRFQQIKEVFKAGSFDWLYLVAGGLLASFIGQMLFYNALKTGETSKVVPLASVYPLVSFILGVVFLNESITPAKAEGLIFIISGIVLLK